MTNISRKVFYLLVLSLLIFASGNFGQGDFLGVKKAFGYGGSGGSVGRTTVVPTPIPTAPAVTAPTPAVSTVPAQVLGIETFRFTEKLGFGSRGDEVRELQKVLNERGLYAGKIDGIFGSITLTALRSFQMDNNLKPVGFVGPGTQLALNNYLSSKTETPVAVPALALATPGSPGVALAKPGEQDLEQGALKFEKNLKLGSRGDDTTKLQKVLKELGLYAGKIDGIFGRLTFSAVKNFQAANALLSDGVVGPKTKEILNK